MGIRDEYKYFKYPTDAGTGETQRVTRRYGYAGILTGVGMQVYS